MNNNQLPLIVIVGPTGVGKSKLSVSLAKIINGEIVNADAYQMYKGMDIGTGKLSLFEQKNIPHHLLSKFYVTDHTINAIIFRKHARDIIKKIHLKRKIPILVGGSGLYIKFAIDDFTPYPSNLLLKNNLRKEIKLIGYENMSKKLSHIDDKFNLSQKLDSRRLIRAYEVIKLTGESFFKNDFFNQKKYYFKNTIQIGLVNKKYNVYYQFIEQRVNKMIRQGLEKEVKQLLRDGIKYSKCRYAIGYKHFIKMFDGELKRQEVEKKIILATKQLIKKQYKWFSKDQRIIWFSEDDELKLLNRIMNKINSLT